MRASSNATTAVASSSRPANEDLAVEIAQLSPQRLDIFFVDLDVVLEGLQPFQHLRKVALVAAALRFLLGELLLRLGEQPLLGGEFLLQDLALALLGVGARLGRL